MAAVGLFPAVVVEGYSMRVSRAQGRDVYIERVGLLDGRLLRRGSRRVFCRARHGCYGWVDVIAFVVGAPAGSPSRGGVGDLVCQQPGQGPSVGRSTKNNDHATGGLNWTDLHRHVSASTPHTHPPQRLNATTRQRPTHPSDDTRGRASVGLLPVVDLRHHLFSF